MEELLQKIEQENGLVGKLEPYSKKDVTEALSKFAEALRQALPILQQQQEEEKEEDVTPSSSSNINAKWLLDICGKVPSELGPTRLARAVWEASHLTDEGQKQEALFTALGASEEAMTILFEIAPNLSQIQKNISLLELSDDGGTTAHFHAASVETFVDPEEARRQKLRQEALDAAHVAAIAKAEAESALAPSMSGATHTITRSSDLEAQKVARKAAKRAAQAMQRAKDAGAIIEESDLLAIDNSSLGAGGLIGRSAQDLQSLQQDLLPEGSRQYYNKVGLPSDAEMYDDDIIGYQKVILPAPRRDTADLHPRLRISDILDPECGRAFEGTTSLNPMQSEVFDTAFNRRENMLVCAPTGAGKTNVAMLTVTAHFRDVGFIGDSEKEAMETGKKVTYIAPMKALAQEVVEKFSSKLKPLGLIVRELTGDMQLSRAEAQSANVIVTTPEKWDVVTRKAGNDENSLGNQCGLLIIDEVHLLADDRGAVIESVVSRLHRLVESRQKQLRIVGLSATLPNYQDVAEFLQVPERGLFYFGPEHRPVPLQQAFVGVLGKVRDRFLMETKMNEVCYETVADSLRRGYQVMVFVHSRKGTGDTASALADLATKADELDRLFVTQGKEGPHGEAYKRFVDRAKKSRNREVSNHFYNGMGIHHAGMLRGDRKLTESMFAAGAIKVLCCTATLAWGINLPAHTVVIKGTDVYNPEKGKSVDLSILDVQQIFGRAGRPQFDSSGEATLITHHEALSRYLDKMVKAVPIESNFVKQLADHLNAEIVGGTVTNIREAATWLGYTYLYVRMLRNPLAYGISADQKNDDPMLRSRCMELVEQAAILLGQNKMINYHQESGNLGRTELGRVAAHFYIQAESVTTFNERMALKPKSTDRDICYMICCATEFENVRVRQEEQDELDSLMGKCPLQLEGPIHDSATKCFVLLQAFISREKIKSFTLISDTNYIAANAGRVARAIFEMCIKANKAATALQLLRFAKSVDNQFWWFQSPLRHFGGELKFPLKLLETRILNNKSSNNVLESTLSLLDMAPGEVGQLCKMKKEPGRNVQNFIRMLPKPKVTCRAIPVASYVLRLHVRLEPDFKWYGRWHGGAQTFWLWVEDMLSDRIYHEEHIVFSKSTYPEPIELDFPIPIFEPRPSEYTLRVVSDSWVGVEIEHQISLRDIKMPEFKTVYTDLQDLTPLPTTALQDSRYEQLYSHIETFNPVQTQLFHVLYHTNSPVLLGAPTGSGKTFVAEIALLRMKRLHPDGICVYIAPLKSLARERLKEWQKRLGSPPLKWRVLELSGDTRHDQKVLQNADVLVCTPEKWDLISRSWRTVGGDSSQASGMNKKSFIKRVRLLVIDEIHLLGEERGAVLEAIVSRTRFISQHLEQVEGVERQDDTSKGTRSEIVRIVGLSTAVANPLDLAGWIGIDIKGSRRHARRGLYNFRPSIRPVPTDVHVQGYPGKHYCPRMATMNKPCYAAIKQHAPDRPSLIFVASRRQTRLTAFDIISYAAHDENPKAFLGCDDSYINAVAESIHDEALRHTIGFGIGLHHAGLSSHDRDIVERLYLSGEIRVLVATATLAWGVNLPARLVIVKGTEYFDGKTSRYVDYPLTDVLQMIGRAGRPGFDDKGEAVVLVEMSKKTFYKKFLYSPFPVESCLSERLCENLNAEIAIGTINSVIEAVGYLTWTFFARRVKANPSYYGAESSSDEHVEAFLFSVAKDALEKLRVNGCIHIEDSEDDARVRPTMLGFAATNYYLQYRTPKQMQFGIQEAHKIISREVEASKESTKGSGGQVPGKIELIPFSPSKRVDEVSAAWILYTLSCTHEFDELPVRHNEEILNEELSDELMWGPDTASLLSTNGDRPYVNPEVFEDSHTKCFLLLQAYLERAKLPISDYVNDTKTVMDNVPRLLAAMEYTVLKDASPAAGSFDVVCQFDRTRQILETRSPVDIDPILQLPGLKPPHLNRLSQEGTKTLRMLRSLSRDDAATLFKRIFKGKNGAPIKPILDTLYSAPLISAKDVQVTHHVDKSSGESRGTLKVSLQVQRQGGNVDRKREDNSMSLSLVLGTFKQRILLAHTSIQISRGGSWSVTKEMGFNWSVANADGGDGGGCMTLRLLLDRTRGLDSELRVRLS